MKAKKIILSAAVILVFVLGCGGYFFVKNNASIMSEIYMRRAESCKKDEEPLKAAYLYEKVLSLNPKNAPAAINYAKLNISLGNYTKAEEELLKCTQNSNNAIDAYTALSGMYVGQGRIKDAVELLNNIPNELIRAKIGAIRPTAPIFSPDSGRYSEKTEISLKNAENISCYYTMSDSDTAEFENPWEENIVLPMGKTTIKAVAVGSNGLVSDITDCAYNVDDLSAAVTFKDSTVEAMVRAALSRYSGHITVGELKSVTSLCNSQFDGKKIGGEISTFSDFQYLRNLTELSLANLSELPNLSGLSVLTSLKSLTLNNCGINSGSISTLSNMPNLNALDLSDNSLDNISCLSEFSKAEYISLKNNLITDVTPLLTFENLIYLDLSGNPLGNITAIGLLPKLKALTLSNCKLSDITALKSLTALTHLDISNNHVSDIEPLSACISLENIIAGNNSIAILSPLSGLPKINSLDLHGNNIRSIRPLMTLENLKTLNINQNSVNDLSALRSCDALQTVFAEGNPIDVEKAVQVLTRVQIYTDD